jgi:nitrogenase molybdenum-iron protein alpha/beta subunit
MLDGTTAEIKPREALRINPAKTCQPIGAMYASLGINGCMPHSHGSQGCRRGCGRADVIKQRSNLSTKQNYA